MIQRQWVHTNKCWKFTLWSKKQPSGPMMREQGILSRDFSPFFQSHMNIVESLYCITAQHCFWLQNHWFTPMEQCWDKRWSDWLIHLHAFSWCLPHIKRPHWVPHSRNQWTAMELYLGWGEVNLPIAARCVPRPELCLGQSSDRGLNPSAHICCSSTHCCRHTALTVHIK